MISPPSISAIRVTRRFMNSRSWEVMSRAPGARAQERLEPDDRLDVEVVGGLVHQQHVGPAEEHAGHGHAHLPAAGERAHVAVDALVVEAEAVQDLARLRLQRVAAEVVVLLLHLAEAGEDGVHLVRARGIAHGVLQRLQLVVQVAHAAAARDGLVEHGAARHLLHVLAEVADGELPGDRDLALVGGLLAHDHAEEGRLARAVGPDEADLLARVELEGGVDEEDLPAVLLAEVGEGDHTVRVDGSGSTRLRSARIASAIVAVCGRPLRTARTRGSIGQSSGQ